MLRIALQSKGRLNEDSLALLQNIGIEVDAPKRKLLSRSQTFPIEALYLRDDDIPHVVAGGTATLGIVGLNEVEEKPSLRISHGTACWKVRLSGCMPASRRSILPSGSSSAVAYPASGISTRRRSSASTASSSEKPFMRTVLRSIN